MASTGKLNEIAGRIFEDEYDLAVIAVMDGMVPRSNKVDTCQSVLSLIWLATYSIST